MQAGIHMAYNNVQPKEATLLGLCDKSLPTNETEVPNLSYQQKHISCGSPAQQQSSSIIKYVQIMSSVQGNCPLLATVQAGK